MKIIQLIQKPQIRGAELFACQLSNHLIRSGNEVLVVSIFSGDAHLPLEGEILNLDRPLSHRFFDLKGWSQFSKIIKSTNPDIIQANAGDTLKFAVFSKLLHSWKNPIIFRNASTVSSYIKSLPVFWINGFLFKYVSLVVSVSEYSRADLLKLFPFLGNRIVTIPIGIELDDTRTIPATVSPPYLLHVGGFTFEKNHMGLFRIFSSLLKTHSHLELWLIGEGPLTNSLKDAADSLKISKQVRFLGTKQNVVEFIKNAKVLVLPSLIEGLPAVILEAFSQKTPVVAYDVGGISEVLTEETGWLVKAGDETGFVHSVIKTLDLNGDTKKIENAYSILKNKFENRAIAQRFLKVYQEVSLLA